MTSVHDCGRGQEGGEEACCRCKPATSESLASKGQEGGRRCKPSAPQRLRRLLCLRTGANACPKPPGTSRGGMSEPLQCNPPHTHTPSPTPPPSSTCAPAQTPDPPLGPQRGRRRPRGATAGPPAPAAPPPSQRLWGSFACRAVSVCVRARARVWAGGMGGWGLSWGEGGFLRLPGAALARAYRHARRSYGHVGCKSTGVIRALLPRIDFLLPTGE